MSSRSESVRDCEKDCGLECRKMATRKSPDLHTFIYRCRKIKSCIEECKTNCSNLEKQCVNYPSNPCFQLTGRTDNIDYLHAYN